MWRSRLFQRDGRNESIAVFLTFANRCVKIGRMPRRLLLSANHYSSAILIFV